jgi:hypothetical protein
MHRCTVTPEASCHLDEVRASAGFGPAVLVGAIVGFLAHVADATKGTAAGEVFRSQAMLMSDLRNYLFD